jgi:hypothetical protein
MRADSEKAALIFADLKSRRAALRYDAELERLLMQNDNSKMNNPGQPQGGGSKSEEKNPSSVKHRTFLDYGASPDSKSVRAPTAAKKS